MNEIKLFLLEPENQELPVYVIWADNENKAREEAVNPKDYAKVKPPGDTVSIQGPHVYQDEMETACRQLDQNEYSVLEKMPLNIKVHITIDGYKVQDLFLAKNECHYNTNCVLK